ncbi:Rapamycin-insensitive companion of mTOR, N-term-domain-containing protein [Coemansia spiralis]|nr:Rapamycin-insensitive companion of mTOR, N-term-domain-containing protein [Coemansia spiralis]
MNPNLKSVPVSALTAGAAEAAEAVAAVTATATTAAATTTTPATTVVAAGADTIAGMEDWASLDYLSEGVFGSIDGRARSTSGSTIYRTGTGIHTGSSDFASSATSYPFDSYGSTGVDQRLRGGSAPYIQTGFAQEDCIVRLENCSESSEPDKVDECLSELVVFLDRQANTRTQNREEPALYPDVVVRSLSHHLPRLLSHFKWYIRARTYKLLRRLPSPRLLAYCWQYLELCIMHTLAREDSAHEEREQSLKFIRWTMRFSEDLWIVEPPVLKALMVVSEQADDKMRNICLETLCEVLALAPKRLWYVNGIRTLTQAALDGPWSISISIACSLALIFDKPETRKFIHPGITLGGVTSALTEPVGKDPMLAERAKVAAFMLAQFLKSWSGIQYFLSDNRKVIKALVEALSMADSNGKIILAMLLELFGLSDDFDTVQFEQQPRFDVELLSPFHLPAYAITQGAARTRLLPVDYMRTLLLMLFVDEGLVEALVAVSLESAQPDIVDASATLLKWLSQHPHVPLPEKYVSRFQKLDLLVNNAMAENAKRSLNAKRIICKIESIPSLSMGQLPSQQMDSWATCLSSSTFYRQFLCQRRLRQQIGSQDKQRTRRSSHTNKSDIDCTISPEAASALSSLLSAGSIISKSSTPFGNASAISGSKGLAAGLKDNAARVLRSSASTGNLKAAAASALTPSAASNVNLTMLGPLNEGPSTPKGEHSVGDFDNTSYRGRCSLDITRNLPQHQQLLLQQQQQQQQQQLLPHILRGLVTQSGGRSTYAYNTSSAMGSPYVHVENTGLALAPSMTIGNNSNTSVATAASTYSQITSSTVNLPGASSEVVGTPMHLSFINTANTNTNSGNGSGAISLNSNSNNNSSSATLGTMAGGSNTGLITPLSAVPGPAPPLITRTRTKSRSRSRNSIVIVNSSGVEETPLSSLIQDSRVITEENPMRWDWDVVRTVILGHISQSRRLPEEVTVTGFLSRLSLFFHPSSLEFCDLSRTTSNEEYLEIGRQLIRILISSADGLLLIDESNLLSGIVDEIRKQNSYARKQSRDESCFSFARLQMTMSPGYFHFLSEIEHSLGGDSLLERNRLFDAYYQVVELPDQVLLVQYILSSMNYCASESHARNILRKVASAPHEPLRLLVPGFLLYLASASPCQPGSVSAWAIEVLLSLVYDASPAVRSAAAQCLVLAIDLAHENPHLDRGESDARIGHLLDLQPMFDLAVITDIRPLVLRVIGTERGYMYLKEQGMIDSEMEAWGAMEGIFYVQSIELDISRALAFGPLFSSTPDGAMVMTTSSQTPPTPAHLFGELVKSAGGRNFLLGFGIPRLLFETLDNIPWNSSLSADVTGLKATLWAIGAIGASRDGFLMLQPYDAIGKIQQVARETTSLSIKGTCLYAMALLSRSSFAAEVFQEKGWLLCSSCYGHYEFAVPKRLELILDAQGWASGGILDNTYVFSEGPLREPDVTDDLDSVQKEIIESVILMSNHVMVNTASKTLMRLRTSHPHYFRLLPLYCKAMHLVSKYRYRLSTRRFLYDIFDVNLASLHAEMLETATNSVLEYAEGNSRSLDQGGFRRFSSSFSSPLSLAVQNRSASGSKPGDSDNQRKRASTLQEYSSVPTSVFPRRPTNGMLLDSIRPSGNNARAAPR